MNRILTILFILLVFSCNTIYSQESSPAEEWLGELAVGAQKLHIGFTIKVLSDGTSSGTMDVPEQGARNIPVNVLKNDSDSLNISIPALHSCYLTELCINRRNHIRGGNGRYSQLDL